MENFYKYLTFILNYYTDKICNYTFVAFIHQMHNPDKCIYFE